MTRLFAFLKTLLILGRVSNLPSVWTNVLVGFLWTQSFTTEAAFAEKATDFCRIGLGATCFYLAGMFANDWKDQHWDRLHCPQRPIPSGRISPLWVASCTLMLFLAAFALLGFATWPVWFLFGNIILYTATHKTSAWSVIPMAACRASLPLIGSVVAGPLAWWPALSLFFYLLILSSLARQERQLGRVPLVVCLLAGICLHDALWLLLLPNIPLSFGFLAICAFFLTRLLQKFIPAS